MILHLANDPMPYRPIEIVDVSPFHSVIRPASRPSVARRRRTRALVAALVAGIVLLGAMGVGAGGDEANASQVIGFRSAPGHAMPPDLAH